jgi:hypothetical protein
MYRCPIKKSGHNTNVPTFFYLASWGPKERGKPNNLDHSAW